MIKGSIAVQKGVKMNLTVNESMELLTGQGAWHTKDFSGKGIPSARVSDGPNGLRIIGDIVSSINDSRKATCFPCACALAASWDKDAAAAEGNAIAEEAVSEGVSVILGPGINMKRSPLCGRNFEYLSEDPYLAGTLAASYVKALQKNNVGVSLKHFAANSQETRRMTADSVVDERTLREIYLRAFEIVVHEAHPATIMASYNKINGKYSCENKKLLTKILRKEWGFDGLVVSDWGACSNLLKSVLSGMDLEMPDSFGVHKNRLERALSALPEEKREIVLDAIRTSAARVAAMAEKYDPNSPETTKIRLVLPEKDELLKKHHETARSIAEGCAVLLKNDGLLPLTDKKKKLAVIGDLAKNMRYQGNGSSHINTDNVISAVTALENEGYDIIFEKGYDRKTDKPDEVLMEKALTAAKECDIVLFFGGLTDMAEGEGYDRKTLSIPKNQRDLIERLHEDNEKMIFVSFSGAPFEMPFIDYFGAVLHMYLGGEAVGEAVASLVSGRVNPSGKLPETFPRHLSEVPCVNNFGNDTDIVEYREGIFTGYRYYDTFDNAVLFPFGHGLSYTEFSYSNLNCPKKHKDGKLQISFDLENKGSLDGAEVAEVYVENPSVNDGYLRPRKELMGFVKVFLKAGEKKRCTVTLSERSFTIWDRKEKDFSLISGDYNVLVGSSSVDIRLSGKVAVSGKKPEKTDKEAFSPYFEKDIRILSREDFATLYGKKALEKLLTRKHRYSERDSLRILSKKSLTAKVLLKTSLRYLRLRYRKMGKNDPEYVMMRETVMNGNADGVVLNSRGAIPYSLLEHAVRVANGRSADHQCNCQCHCHKHSCN